MTVDGGPPSVVIVDDDIDHAVIMRTVLAAIAPEAEVTVLTDAQAVDRPLLDAPEDAIVLMDRMLSEVESFALVEAVTGARPDLSVVLLSASLDDADRTRALAAGAMLGAEKPDSFDGWRALFGTILREAGWPAEADDAVA